MRKRTRAILAVLILVVAAQSIPVDRSSAPVGDDLQIPPAVTEVLRRSCFDCHSSETRWPWYAHVAPVSWVLARHVEEGRGHLDFTNWNGLDARKRSHLIGEILDETSQGEMPLGSYLWLHSEAKLSGADLETLREWAQASPSHEASH